VIFDHPSSVVPVKSPTVSFAIKNVGRSTALLRSVAATVEHLTKMVAKPRVEFLANYAIEPIVDPQAETARQFTQQLIIPIDRDANDSITKGDSHIFLYGEIVFSDVLGTDYIQTFCLSYDRHAKRFVPLGSKYNRRTRQKPEEA
jgi:hypothetical protein